MTPERWKQVTDLFHSALERAGDRAAFLDEATRHDPDLRREVDSLLRAHHSSAEFLETPAWGVAPELMFEERLRGVWLPANAGRRFTESAIVVVAILFNSSAPSTETGVGAS